MEKRKTIVIGSLVAAVVIMMLTYGLTYSYLIDVDAKDNIITIGNVDLEIVETGYTDSQPVVAQQIVNKAPKIKNTGNKNEYVFMTVQVPKRNVTLLHEDTVADPGGHKEGTFVDSTTPTQNVEIFKMLTNNETNMGRVTDNDTNNVVFHYNKGSDTIDTYVEGWVLVESPSNYSLTNDYDEFTFGYNKLLAPGDTTTNALFDKVKLKSFIDQEVSEANTSTEVKIIAYGIQTENLVGINNFTDNTSSLSKTDLDSIWGIVNNKKTQSYPSGS